MVDVVDVVLAGVLGAALLAVSLLYSGYRRNRALIRELRAELRAIALGTLHEPPDTPAARPPDTGHLDRCPVRRAAHRLWPRPLRRQVRQCTSPASAGTIGVRDEDDMTKEPYGARSIPAPAPADDEHNPCDNVQKSRHGGDGGVIKRGPLKLLR